MISLEDIIKQRLRPTRPALRLALVIGVVSAVASCLWITSAIQNFGENMLALGLSKLERLLMMPVHVGYYEIGFGKVILEEVIIGDFGTAVFDQITVEVVTNPISEDFGKIGAINLGRAGVKLRHRDFSNLLDRLSGTSLKMAGEEDESAPVNSLGYLAGNLSIRNADLNILDGSGRSVTELRGLNGELNTRDLTMNFNADQVHFFNDWRLDNPTAKIDYQTAKRRFVLQLTSTENIQAPKNSLQIEAVADRDLKRGRLRYQLKGIPNLPLKHRVKNLMSRGHLRFTEDTKGSYEITGKVQGELGLIKLPFLSTAGIGPFFGEAHYEATFTPGSRTILLRSSQLKLGQNSKGPHLTLNVSGIGQPDPNRSSGMSWGGFVDLPQTDCSTIKEALAPSLIPNLADFRVAGPMRFNFEFSMQSAEMQNFNHFFHLRQFDCKILHSPPRFSKRNLKSGRAFSSKSGSTTTDNLQFILKGGRNFLTDAFTTAEDAAFWLHDGIDETSIVTAFRRNLDQGRIAMGGSTITMQTVKNLFLSHERTISRKFQEVFLAWHLEQVLEKREILELYLNIIEFGPGIFGITDAARRFFDKTPEELNLKEAAYLASVLPSPKRRYQNYCQGHLSDGYKELLDSLLKRMHNLKRIDYSTLRQALGQPLQFQRRNFPDQNCQQLAGEDPS